MAIKSDPDGDRDYNINALGQVFLPPASLAGSSSLLDLLSAHVHPKVMERLNKLSSPDETREGRDLRRELLLKILQATPSTSVSFQERLFDEEPVEEDVISFSINEAGDVTILLG